MTKLPGRSRKIFYQISAMLVRLTLTIFWRLQVQGKEFVPRQGKLLLASNHISNADPPIVGVATPRPIFYFAKEELFRVPIFGWLIRQLNAFAVRRYDHDIGAFKQAQSLLELEQTVIIFPEGRRSKTGKLGRAKAGIAMLAFKTGAPVVPLYISGSKTLLQFKRVRVFFGAPILPSAEQIQNKNYQEFADQVMNAIAQLQSKNV